MKKVLIISYSFPPLNNIAARRYGEMVPYMSNFGWKPFIVTTSNKGDLIRGISEQNIIRTGEHHQKDLLIKAFENKGIPGFLRPGYFLYKKLNLNFKTIDRYFFSWAMLVLKKLDYIRKIDPNIILASYGPATSLWLGNLLSRKIKKPWIADFRDPCSLSNDSSLRIFDKWADKLLVSSASGITTVSPTLAFLLSRFYNKKTIPVFNGFKIESILDQNYVKRNDKKQKKIIYYAGRIYFHQIDSIKLLIKWLAKCGRNDMMFNIRSLGPQKMNIEINNYAKKLGVSRLVNILEPAQEEIVKKELQDASILTVFEDLKMDKLVSAGTLTGKFLKLLPFKKPIVSIARKDSDIGKILRETNTGFLSSDFTQLEIVMERILSDKFVLDPNWKNIQKYSVQYQCKKLCSFLDEIIEIPNKNV